jgi:alpha-ketoglutarate-dependent 2,4-dichlorophenoxyacetate dioxygenase
VKIQAIDGSFPAEVIGVDGRSPLDGDRVSRLRHALNQHHVLIVRDLHLSKIEQLRFTLQFGDLDEHAATNAGKDIPEVHDVSNLDDTGIPAMARLGSTLWHSDKSYRQIPSDITFLQAVTLPPEGGTTDFADMTRAFHALPESEQRELSAMRVIHCWATSEERHRGRIVSEDERHKWPPVAQPLARQQWDGRRALFMGHHASHLGGLPVEQGRDRLAKLEAHATSANFVYRHHWAEGDLLMWDNGALLHRANTDFDGDRWPRVLHRTVTKGLKKPT